jgi:fucose permease
VTRRRTTDAGRSIPLVAYASFLLTGWTSLLIPSLLRVLEGEFARSDAEFGVVYFVVALLFAVGALTSGLVAERVGRTVVLPTAALLIAGGLAVEGLAPAWPVFLVGAALVGAGWGSITAVVSSVIMDLSSAGSGSGLNRLHLFYSVGALTGPLAVGTLVGLGVEWRAIVLATALAALALAAPLARLGAVPARPPSPAVTVAPGRMDPRAVVSTGLRLALAALGVAAACYVAAESGVSSWLVRFLDAEPMTVATLALGLFWAGLAIGRLVASRIADRFDPVPFTTACGLAGGIVILVAATVASGPVRISLFLVAGFAFGPVYPMIMAVAGSLFPHRAAAVAGVISATGTIGAIAYPPLMGLLAGVAGLRAGMVGAALLIFAAGAAVVAAGRLAGRRRGRPEPEPARPAPAD